jgi:hypothetical protein
MERQERDRQIGQYEGGYQVVVEALNGITERGLDAREGPAEWSPREVVHHLADSEMTSAIRLRRFIAEDRPLLVGYDQEEFARRLYYDRPIDASLAAFKAARESTAQILRCLTEKEWAREGTHSEYGRQTVIEWLGYYALHAHEHADQIRRARATVDGQ